MTIHDISLTIHPRMPVWPGDPPVQLQRVSRMEDGDHANVTQVFMSAHTGTHVDAPYHFLGGDAPTVDQLPLDVLTGEAYVLELPERVALVTSNVLREAGVPARARRLLLKTRNSRLWARKETCFETGFVAISPDGAQYLVECGIQLVGVDYLSVAPFSEGVPTHQTLLKAGVVVLEGLDLSEVSQGYYSLCCLPLKIAGSDGAPARAILVTL